MQASVSSVSVLFFLLCVTKGCSFELVFKAGIYFVSLTTVQPPPSGVAELEEYMRNTVGKEIDRNDLEFGKELGAGEFGAVFEGILALWKLNIHPILHLGPVSS